MPCWARVLPRPLESQPSYGASLGDASYWGPWVREVLSRHALVGGEPVAGFVGSFPVFLCGDVVVKLFASAFDGHACWAVELACREAPLSPAVLASGTFYEDGDWPYVVFERVAGVAWRDLSSSLSPSAKHEVAAQLGEAVRAVHSLPAPAFRTTLLAELRATAASRAKLPPHLLAQVDDYLRDALPATHFVHGDITEDHVYIDRSALVAIIDWGDALLADPYYELCAVFSGTFAGDLALFRTFLDAYAWPVDDAFPKRMLQAMLSFQFNAFYGMSLPDVATLDELAAALFARL